MNIGEIHAKAQEQFNLVDAGPVKYVVSTGSVILDRALSIGGYPSGRIVEIYGPEMAGKTTLALHAMAEAQEMGEYPALIDMERALDETYAGSIGLKGKPNKEGGYLVETPDYGEQAFEVIEFLIDMGIKFIVVDSVSAMTPKAEIEGDYGESHMGLQARMMSQGMRKIVGKVAENDVVLIFINQIRMKIGVMFGSPETTTGGNALKFYASMRLDIRAGSKDNEIKNNAEIVGKYSKVKIVKNKLGPPMRTLMIPIIFGKGIWQAGELLDELLVVGAITKKSSYFYLNDSKIGAGKFNSISWIDENLEQCKEILIEYKKDTST